MIHDLIQEQLQNVSVFSQNMHIKTDLRNIKETLPLMAREHVTIANVDETNLLLISRMSYLFKRQSPDPEDN